MDKAIVKQKNLRRKYKHYVAALVGTAIMTGAALPGIPIFSQAFASEKKPSPPIEKKQETPLKKDGWHEHKDSWPSSGDNQAWYENGHIYYLNDRHQDNRYQHDHFFQEVSNPVNLVKTYAAQYGFDSERDSFTLIHQGHRKATVQVIKTSTGQRFKIDLERNRGDWQITVIRGIGDQNFPASYRTVSNYFG